MMGLNHLKKILEDSLEDNEKLHVRICYRWSHSQNEIRTSKEEISNLKRAVSVSQDKEKQLKESIMALEKKTTLAGQNEFQEVRLLNSDSLSPFAP